MHMVFNMASEQLNNLKEYHRWCTMSRSSMSSWRWKHELQHLPGRPLRLRQNGSGQEHASEGDRHVLYSLRATCAPYGTIALIELGAVYMEPTCRERVI